MKLIWTYNYDAIVGGNVGAHTFERRIILLNYYILSIQNAKRLGYYCIVYCDSTYKHIFDTIADEVHLVESTYKYSILWDSYKIAALEARTDDGEYCLIDGDLILHKKLPKFEETMVFDSYEIHNWSTDYKHTIQQMTDVGIQNVIPEWVNKRMPIMSCGILYINNSEFKNIYINRWHKCNELIQKYVDTIDADYGTMVSAQYLLTLLVNHYKISYRKMAMRVGDDNIYYKHHSGSTKYNKPCVPTNYIIDVNVKKILL